MTHDAAIQRVGRYVFVPVRSAELYRLMLHIGMLDA